MVLHCAPKEKRLDRTPMALRLSLLDRRGLGSATQVLADLWNWKEVSTARTTNPPRLYIHASDSAQTPWLVCYEMDGEDLVERWRVQLPALAELLQRCGGAGAWVVLHGVGGLRLVPLGGEAPDLSREPSVLPVPWPKLESLSCLWGNTPDRLKVELSAATKGKPWQDARGWLHRQFRSRPADEGLGLLWLMVGVPFAVRDRILSGGIEALHAAHPEHPEVRLEWALRLIEKGLYTDALAALDDFDDAGLEARLRAHLWHLRGFAQQALGRLDDAARSWRVGAPYDAGPCGLREAVAMTAPLEDPAVAAMPFLAAQRARLALADQCLAGGDGAGALAALKGVDGWRCLDDQTLARRARATLLSPPRTPASWVRARVALGLFVAIVREWQNVDGRRRAVWGGAVWPHETLTALATECEAWLDATDTYPASG